MSKKIDVAVVGGGIAGLHVAWRLTDSDYQIAGQKRSVIVFEATDHLGGRLKSIDVKGVNFPLELGAMRFKRTHYLLNGLIEHLGEQDGEMGIPPGRYYLRGRRQNTFRQLASKAYLLPANEREFASSPDSLILLAIHQALRKLEFPWLTDRESEEIVARIRLIPVKPRRNKAEQEEYLKQLARLDWDIITSPNGGFLQLGPKAVPLISVGFWNLLAHFLSNQAMRLIEDGLGYHSIIGNWNASVALPWFIADFGDTEFYVPLQGFSSMVNQLAQRIRKHGGVIKTGSRLAEINPAKTKGYKWELTFEQGKTKRVYEAKRVVLAMPRVALEKLRIKARDWPDVKDFYLPTVKPHNLLKILLVYEEAWWTTGAYPGGESGKVITDQPLRQIYYYGTKWIDEHTQKSLKQTKTWPFIMASYCDSYYTEFWSRFFSRFWQRGINESYFNPPKNWESLDPKAKKALKKVIEEEGVHWRLVNKIHRQLTELHQKKIPKPILGVFMNWDSEPYWGGWHTWELDTLPGQTQMLEAIPGIHICGEAYSNQQGWIEGALKTAELVLMHKFNLSPPHWYAGPTFEKYLFNIIPEETQRRDTRGK